jgi:hypothetical protein
MKDHDEDGIGILLFLWWLFAIGRFAWISAQGRSPTLENALLQWGTVSILLSGRIVFRGIGEALAPAGRRRPAHSPDSARQADAAVSQEGQVRS